MEQGIGAEGESGREIEGDEAGRKLYQLCYGLREGGADKAAELIGAGADLSWADEKGRDAALWAAIFGNVEMVKLFLDRGLPARHRSEKTGLSLLSYAARNGKWECARLLAERGAIDASERGADGQHALHCACEANVDSEKEDLDKARIIRLLLPHFDPREVYDGKFRYSSIHAVCQTGGTESLKAVYEPGMETLRDAFGHTGLMRSVRFGHLGQVRWWASFLDEETLSMRHGDGKSALDFALERGGRDGCAMAECLRAGLAQSRKRALEASARRPKLVSLGKPKSI